MDPSQANVCAGLTHCTYLWETHTSASCWGSVLMLGQVTTASSVVRDTTSSPLRPEWLTLQEQTEGQMWRISALRLIAGPSGPPWLPDPVPGAALGQECPHPRQRWPQARGWLVLFLPEPHCGSPGPPVVLLFPLTLFPISSRSPSRHPARPPGPFHGAVHEVSGLRERNKCYKLN